MIARVLRWTAIVGVVLNAVLWASVLVVSWSERSYESRVEDIADKVFLDIVRAIDNADPD